MYPSTSTWVGARRALSLLSTVEMPASPPTNVIHVVMHDVRADIDTPALSALRSDGATYTFSLAFTQAPWGRSCELAVGTVLLGVL